MIVLDHYALGEYHCKSTRKLSLPLHAGSDPSTAQGSRTALKKLCSSSNAIIHGASAPLSQCAHICRLLLQRNHIAPMGKRNQLPAVASTTVGPTQLHQECLLSRGECPPGDSCTDASEHQE